MGFPGLLADPSVMFGDKWIKQWLSVTKLRITESDYVHNFK